MPYKELWQKQAYQRQWKREKYEKERDELVELLGGKCQWCGSNEKLEVHHDNGDRDWDLVKVSCLTRIRRYRKEYEAGVKMYLLCKKCHKRELDHRHWGKPMEQDDVPF